MVLKFTATDTLFFRDGRPFTSGEENVANVIFPPAPSVVMGSLRSSFLAANTKLDITAVANTEQDPTRTARITALALWHRGKAIFPAPADLVRTEEGKLVPLEPVLANGLCDFPLRYLLISRRPAKAASKLFLTSDDFIRYANRQAQEFHPVENLFITEEKIGIGLKNESRTAAEGMLYRYAMVRPISGDNTTTEIVVQLENLVLPEKGVLHLGGEGKIAFFQTGQSFVPPLPQITGRYFKLYLATPGIFERGFCFSWLNDKLEGEYAGHRLRLVALAAGKKQRIGGFDMALRKPKPMRDAQPAGTVYYFEALNGNAALAAEALHGQCLSDYGLDQQGFGWALAAACELPD